MGLTDKEKLKREKLKLRNVWKVVRFPISRLKEVADDIFSLYIRFVRDKDKPCITCWRFYAEYDNWHYQIRQHLNTRYAETNCAKQCKGCNKWHQWEQVIFGRRIDEIYWDGTAEALEIYARWISTIKQSDYLEIIEKYHTLVTEAWIPNTIPKKYLTK